MSPIAPPIRPEFEQALEPLVDAAPERPHPFAALAQLKKKTGDA